MSHHIENNTDFASREQIAWHKLGNVFDLERKMTGKEMGELSNTWFDVVKTPNLIERPRISIDEFLAQQNDLTEANIANVLREYKEACFQGTNSASTLRSDTGVFLGTVGQKYEVFQNKEMYSFLEDFRGEDDYVRYETAGCLKGGKVVFVTAKIPEVLRIGADDTIDQYLVITNAHDGSGTLKILWTPIRVVCNNTLGFALQSAGVQTVIDPAKTGHFRSNFVSIKHTQNMRNAVSQAHKFLGLIKQSQAVMEGQLQLMKKARLQDDTYTKWLVDLFVEDKDIRKELQEGAAIREAVSPRTANKIDLYKEFYHGAVGQKGIVGTAWGGYNAITYGLTHGSTWSKDGHKNLEQSFAHSFVGTAQTGKSSRAWNMALKHSIK